MCFNQKTKKRFNHLQKKTMSHLTSISFIIYTYLLINTCNGQQTPISCNNTDTFTGDSAFAANREQLRYTLILTDNVPADNFFGNVSVGNGSDTIYCKAICQADYTARRCTESISDLLNDLFIKCPNEKEATSVGTRNIHYSNRPVLGRLELEPTRVVPANNGGLDSSEFDNTMLFYRIWDSLMARVSEIASEKPLVKYATGETYLSESDRRAIYVFMQCYPDLSPIDCRYCLNKTVSYYRSNLRGNGGGSVQKPSCWFRWEFNRFYQIKADIALPPTTPPTKGGTSSRTVGFMVVALGCFLLLLTLLYVLYRRNITSNLRYRQDDGFEGINVEAVHYDFHTLRSATDNFSIHNMLGQGGFGTVYKGRLPNGESVAVKRWSEDSTQGEVEFENEVTLMAQLEHRNLVRLLGYCFQQTERLLVYEFVPNQSLDFYIFDSQRRLELDWKKRFKIIEGITRGILYLHQDSRLQIIHRDLKPSNILLDEQMNPKISDFGTAKLFAVDHSQMCTRRIVGTYGYMPPEYAIYGQTSTKSDIFSFGVLVLEIMSGKKVGGNGQSNDNNLLSYTWRNWKDGTPLNVIDKNLLRSGSREEMIRCIHIALLCVQEDLGRRPTMASIVVMLSSHTVSLPVPSKPAYLMTAKDFDVQPSRSPQFEMTRQSVYEISVTELSPR